MGFKDNQFVITRHTDTEHEHIHILANRITHAGEVMDVTGHLGGYNFQWAWASGHAAGLAV